MSRVYHFIWKAIFKETAMGFSNLWAGTSRPEVPIWYHSDQKRGIIIVLI